MKYLVIFFSFFLLSCNTEEDVISDPVQYDNLSAVVKYNELDGVPSNLLSLDVYYNSNLTSKKPIVFWVHGGGWSIGDKTYNIEDKRKLFQSLDYVLVSVNYRLSPYPYEVSNLDRVMFPTHNNDVADAIKWVYDNIDQYGGNPNKIALLGFSAGAHLVALTGTNESFLENVGLSLSNIKGVAAIDTKGYNVPDKIQINDESYINAFGTDPNSNIDASPVHNIESGVVYPKFFIAKRGSAQRIAIAETFIDSLTNNGVDVSQVDGSIYNHGGINNAIGEADETLITNPLKSFLVKCFE